MFILQKNPANGCIDIAKKTYDLAKLGPEGRRPNALMELIRDTSKCLLDSLVNLRPISAYSAKALYDANYREFLSSVLEGGRKIDIQTHCWHLFTPKFKGQDETKTRLASHLTGDYEDPEKTSNPHPDLVNFEERPEEYPAAMRSTVVPVTTQELNYENFNTAFLENLPLNRAIRDEFGETTSSKFGKHQRCTYLSRDCLESGTSRFGSFCKESCSRRIQHWKRRNRVFANNMQE